MKEFKGTPGLWHVQFGDEIYAGDGVDNEQVATANDCHDADLISAAPEILSVMKKIVESGYILPHLKIESQWAIAKALGE